MILKLTGSLSCLQGPDRQTMLYHNVPSIDKHSQAYVNEQQWMSDDIEQKIINGGKMRFP
jgi:hypothetical protein